MLKLEGKYVVCLQGCSGLCLSTGLFWFVSLHRFALVCVSIQGCSGLCLYTGILWDVSVQECSEFGALDVEHKYGL